MSVQGINVVEAVSQQAHLARSPLPARSRGASASVVGNLHGTGAPPSYRYLPCVRGRMYAPAGVGLRVQPARVGTYRRGNLYGTGASPSWPGSQVGKAADCKSAIVSSTLTRAFAGLCKWLVASWGRRRKRRRPVSTGRSATTAGEARRFDSCPPLWRPESIRHGLDHLLGTLRLLLTRSITLSKGDTDG